MTKQGQGLSEKMVNGIKFVPEFNFILLCAGTEPDRDRCSRIKKAANASLDWDLIYKTSIDQRITPLLYKNIQTLLPDRVPAGILKKYKNTVFYKLTRPKSLDRLGEFRKRVEDHINSSRV